MRLRRNYAAGAARVIGERAPRLGARLGWRLELRRDGRAQRVVDTLVRPGDVVVDVGANAGMFTERMARLVGRSGRVHAFEPNPFYWPRLEAVAAGRANVVLHRTALSDRPGEATLRVPSVGGRTTRERGSLAPAATREHAVEEALTVAVDTLDRALAGEPGRVAFVKCDVEGHEDAVLRGGAQVLRRDRPMLLVEMVQRYREEPAGLTVEWLRALGYEAHALLGEGLAPVERCEWLLRGEVVPDETLPANDFLFVPPERPLPQALPRAPA